MSRQFSGEDVYTVLVNTGNFRPVAVTGSHCKLEWVHPQGPGVERRVVTVPLTDPIPAGTLRSIADQAGAKDFDAFRRWIERNR